MFSTPHLDSHNTTDPKPEILSAIQTGNRISRDGRNECGIVHVRMCKKGNICWQRRLNHSGVGGGIAFRRVYPARHLDIWNPFKMVPGIYFYNLVKIRSVTAEMFLTWTNLAMINVAWTNVPVAV